MGGTYLLHLPRTWRLNYFNESLRMKLTEERFTQSLEKLEKWLAEDFQVLFSLIKKIPVETKKESPAECNQLVELLQYHDLLRQKIQHVQEINFLLHEEEEKAVKEPDYEKVFLAFFRLMSGLLRFSSQEYAKMVGQLRDCLDKLQLTGEWQEDKFNCFCKESLILIEQTENFCVKAGALQQAPPLKLAAAQEKMQKILKSFSMESERRIYRNVMKDYLQFTETQYLEKDEDSSGEVDLF